MMLSKVATFFLVPPGLATKVQLITRRAGSMAPNPHLLHIPWEDEMKKKEDGEKAEIYERRKWVALVMCGITARGLQK